MSGEAIVMEWHQIHDYYEDNRVELSKTFAAQRNTDNKLFSVESQNEAIEFLEKHLQENNIKLKCDCIGKIAYMLVFSVDSMQLG